MDYINQLKAIEKQKTELVAKLTQFVSSLPQNENIEPISDNAFTVKLSTIIANKSNLSPYFYDFKFQYNTVAEKLLLSEDPLAALNKIILERRVIRSGTPYTLHEEVVANLKLLVNNG